MTPEDIEKRNQLLAEARTAISNNEIKKLEAILAESYIEDVSVKQSEFNPFNLYGDSEREVDQPHSFPYITMDQDGPDLIRYAVNHGGLDTIKYLEKLGAHITINTINNYARLNDKNKEEVTEYIFSSILETKIENANGNDIIIIFEKLGNNAGSQLYKKLFDYAKDAVYARGNEEQLMITQPLFAYNKEYIKTHRQSDKLGSQNLFLYELNQDAKMADNLQADYKKKNATLLADMRTLMKGTGKWFAAQSRETVTTEAVAEIVKLDSQGISNEVTKFHRILSIMANAHNAIQKELNDSFRNSIGIPRGSDTNSGLMQLMKKYQSAGMNQVPNYELKINRETRFVEIQMNKKMELDETIINNFPTQPPRNDDEPSNTVGRMGKK